MNDSEGALDHRSRKLIYNFISTHPGSSFKIIKNFFDLNKSTLSYHLNYLERNKNIRSKREGRSRCYYCTHHIEHSSHIIITGDQSDLNATQLLLVKLIQNNKGITNKELIARTKLNRKNLHYNIKKLREKKLIWAVKTSGILGYEYVTKEKLQHEMATTLISKLLSNEIDEETFLKIKSKLDGMNIEELMK
jgi:predicted transcriptional regulator